MKWILAASNGGTSGSGGGGNGGNGGPIPIGRSRFGSLEDTLPFYWQILLYAMLFFAAIGIVVLVRVQLRNRRERAERVLLRRRRILAELTDEGYLTASAAPAPEAERTSQESPQPPPRTAADFPPTAAHRQAHRSDVHHPAPRRSRKPRTPA